jgi:simple sugar transport system permease protein
MVSEVEQRETGGDAMEPAVSRSLPSRVAAFLLRRPESTVAIAALALAIYFTLASEFFLTESNLRVIANILIPTAILAAGQTMLLICGEIDLSQGAVYFMTPFLVHFAVEARVPLPLAVLLAVLGAGVVGVLNGSISIAIGIPSFIVTLGMMLVVAGFTLNISDAFPKRAPSGGLAVEIFGGARFSGLVWVILIVALLHVVLTKTRWGVYSTAIGGNQLGASEAGVPATKIKMRNFVLSAMLAGFAGIIEGIRIGSFDPGAAAFGNRIFLAVAAAVIGGTLLTGGYGTIIGAFLGALVLAILQDGFNILGVSAFTFNIVLGAAIIAAMVVNSLASKARIRSQSVRL